MSFVVFTRGGKPVVAVPLHGNLAVLRASVAALPDYTLKRKLFKLYALVWASVMWLGRRIGLIRGTALPPAKADLVEHILRFCPDAAAVTPIWSLVPGRARSYFRVFDATAREIAFAKVSTSEPGRTRLKVEAQALQSHVGAQTFACPKVLRLDVIDESVLLLTSALPEGSQLLHAERNPFPEAIHDEIHNTKVTTTMKAIRQTDWFIRGKSTIAGIHAVEGMLAGVEDTNLVTLAPSHGDFGSENFYVDPTRRVHLIDWEHYCDAAPALTDEVGFWIGKNHRAIQRNDGDVARGFSQEFEEYSDSDLLLALIYLAAFDVTDATKLVMQWKS